MKWEIQILQNGHFRFYLVLFVIRLWPIFGHGDVLIEFPGEISSISKVQVGGNFYLVGRIVVMPVSLIIRFSTMKARMMS